AGELAGGAMLVLGVYTRVVAVALLPVLLGAAWVHAGNGWLFTAPKGGWEYPAFLALTAMAVVLLGGGRYSVNATSSPARGSARVPRSSNTSPIAIRHQDSRRPPAPWIATGCRNGSTSSRRSCTSRSRRCSITPRRPTGRRSSSSDSRSASTGCRRSRPA